MSSLVDLGYSISFGGDLSSIQNLLTMTQEIQQNLNNITSCSGNTTNSFNQMGGAIQEVADGMETTGESIEGATDETENMASAVEQVANNTRNMNNSYRDANGRVRETRRNMDNVRNSSNQAGESVKKTARNTEELHKNATQAESAFKSVAKAIGGAFVVKKAMDFGKASMKTFMDFEQGMADVKATMGGVSNKDFKRLSDAAKDAGRTTKFSATQAAEALKYEALAGWDVDKSIKALPTILNVAAAGNMDLKQTSDLVTDAMSALGMEFKDLDKFADQLARTSQRSNTDIDQLGQAILVAGGTAKNAGMDMTAINTELGILADSSYKGAKGGTALRNVLLNITSNDQVHDFLNDLGVKTADATGKIRPLNSILVDLKGKLNGMTESQRMASLAVIGGKENVQGLNILLKGSGKRYEELSKQITNSKNAAKDMAAEQMNTVQGALLGLKSALEGVQIDFMESINKSGLFKKALHGLTNITPKIAGGLKKIGSGLAKLTNFVIKHKNVVIPAVKAIGIALAHLAIIKTVTSSIKTFKTAVKGAKVALTLFTSPVGLIIAAIGLLAFAFISAYRHSETFRANVQKVGSVLMGIVGIVTSVVVPMIVGAISSLFDTMKAIFGNIKQIISGFIQTLSGIIDFIAGVFTGNWSRAWEGIKNIFGGIVNQIKGIFKGVINSITAGINMLIGGINKIHFKAPDWVPLVGGKEISPHIPTIPRLAKGTDDWRGGIVQVHEKGGEIMDLPSGSRVYPHDKSINMAREQGRKESKLPPVSITINVRGNADKSTANEIAAQVRKEVESIFRQAQLQMGFS